MQFISISYNFSGYVSFSFGGLMVCAPRTIKLLKDWSLMCGKKLSLEWSDNMWVFHLLFTIFFYLNQIYFVIISSSLTQDFKAQMAGKN